MNLMQRRRALMAAQETEPEINYILPSNSAGRGQSVATFTEGNMLHISSIAKGSENDIRGYFLHPITIKSGDTVRLKTTRKTGSFNATIVVMVYVDSLAMNNSTSVRWTSSEDIDLTGVASANLSATYVRVMNTSNARTGSNDGHLVEIFINGKQVI